MLLNFGSERINPRDSVLNPVCELADRFGHLAGLQAHNLFRLLPVGVYRTLEVVFAVELTFEVLLLNKEFEEHASHDKQLVEVLNLAGRNRLDRLALLVLVLLRAHSVSFLFHFVGIEQEAKCFVAIHVA